MEGCLFGTTVGKVLIQKFWMCKGLEKEQHSKMLLLNQGSKNWTSIIKVNFDRLLLLMISVRTSYDEPFIMKVHWIWRISAADEVAQLETNGLSAPTIKVNEEDRVKWQNLPWLNLNSKLNFIHQKRASYCSAKLANRRRQCNDRFEIHRQPNLLNRCNFLN